MNDHSDPRGHGDSDLREKADEDTTTSTKHHIAFEDRFSTFNSWPQYIFPSEANDLTYELETPYAFSHHTPAFFWTRDDALAAICWNIHARLPCLNCVLAGEVHAKLCDQSARQERHRGMIRCCHRCEWLGMAEACVEMIELRMNWMLDHKTSTVNPNLSDPPKGSSGFTKTKKSWKDERIWTKTERTYREEGKVIWRPINLNYGDATWKQEIVAEWKTEPDQSLRRFKFAPSASPDGSEQHVIRTESMKERILLIARQQVDLWDRQTREERSHGHSSTHSISTESFSKSESDDTSQTSEMDHTQTSLNIDHVFLSAPAQVCTSGTSKEYGEAQAT